ncbi:hypothetical protein Hanom_Chr11g01054121 [Helianthus anomalus]
MEWVRPNVDVLIFYRLSNIWRLAYVYRILHTSSDELMVITSSPKFSSDLLPTICFSRAICSWIEMDGSL